MLGGLQTSINSIKWDTKIRGGERCKREIQRGMHRLDLRRSGMSWSLEYTRRK